MEDILLITFKTHFISSMELAQLTMQFDCQLILVFLYIKAMYHAVYLTKYTKHFYLSGKKAIFF